MELDRHLQAKQAKRFKRHVTAHPTLDPSPVVTGLILAPPSSTRTPCSSPPKNRPSTTLFHQQPTEATKAIRSVREGKCELTWH